MRVLYLNLFNPLEFVKNNHMSTEPIKSANSTLLEALRSAKIYTDTDFKFIPSHQPSIALAAVNNIDTMREEMSEWFQNVGLSVNPFAEIDAGQDPFIPFYLIDHDQYNSINGTFTSFVFAPPGCGKSAFRVRLARDCRVDKDRRKIFPIVYKLPAFDSQKISPEKHYEVLAMSAAYELLLYVLHHPSVFVDKVDLLIEIQRIFATNFHINYIQQIVDAESIQPLLDTFDRTAKFLPNPPKKSDLVFLAQKLQDLRLPDFPVRKIPPKERLDQVVSLIIKNLGYESFYVLVDGVDGYVETGNNADSAVDTIDWLLQQNGEWQNNRIYLKYFLPVDLKSALERRFPLLTSESKIAVIKWDLDTLTKVIRQRLQEASGGKYSSLRAISALPLRGGKQAPEEVLAREIVNLSDPTPRNMVMAINVLLTHHVQHNRHDKLTVDDLMATIDWIRRKRLPK